MSEKQQKTPPAPIFIVSGGLGTSGEQIVNSVLAQFPGAGIPVTVFPSIRQRAQLEHPIAEAAETGGTIVHTLVDSEVRQALVEMAKARNVVAVDLMGPLLDRLAGLLGRPPLGRPGFYRQLNRTYFERVSAIEYAMAHDDGRNRQDWPNADAILIGVSRTGKTPLSMYLSVLGWKTANMPIIPDIAIPQELYRVKRTHVIGLTIDIDRLLAYRRRRASHLGMSTRTAYANPARIEEELEVAHQVFRCGGFYVVDVTDKPVESSADEVIRRLEPK